MGSTYTVDVHAHLFAPSIRGLSPVIVAEHLTKTYGPKTAVQDLIFSVQPGVVTGVLGPNGAGKSTTMRMILGPDAPTEGRVTVNGKRYAGHRATLHSSSPVNTPPA